MGCPSAWRRACAAELKNHLVALSESQFELLGPLALTPLIPVRLARRLEVMALGSGDPVGCSNLCSIHPAANRPDGTDAEFMSVRQTESLITAEILDRLRGMLFLASLQVNGKVSITVTAWKPDGPNSREQLTAWARTALEEFGLAATFD